MELPLTITAQEITLPASIEAIIRERRSSGVSMIVSGCHVRVAGPGSISNGGLLGADRFERPLGMSCRHHHATRSCPWHSRASPGEAPAGRARPPHAKSAA